MDNIAGIPQGADGARLAPRDGRARPTRLVAGAMLGNLASANTVVTFTVGMFISALHATYGWSRADIALSMTCFTLVAFLGSSLIGRAADVYAPRTLAVSSMSALGVSLMLVPMVVHSVQTLWLAYVALAVLGLGTSPVVLNRPLMSVFSRRRGLAIALALTGTGIGGFVLPPFTASLVGHGDWRNGFAGLGWLVLAAAPIVWMLLGRELAAPSPPAGVPSARGSGVDLRDIARSRVFWVLSLIALCGGLGMSGPAANLIPMLGDHGLSPQAAARLASLIGVASVTGRVLTGIGLDRFDTPLPGAPLLGLGAVGLVLLAHFSAETAPLGIMLLGFVIGAEIAILAYYTSRYFELRAHATIFGWAYGAVAFGSAAGPVLVGALRDQEGNYGMGFLLSAVALAVASLSCLLLGPYRYATDG